MRYLLGVLTGITLVSLIWARGEWVLGWALRVPYDVDFRRIR